jgi:hypothetical protein
MYGQKICTIIDFALDTMGLKTACPKSEETYYQYVNLLQNKLKCSEPYKKHIRLEKVERRIIMRQMTDLLPHNNIKFEPLIEKAADEVIENLSDIRTPLLNTPSESVISEFVTLKIVQLGDNIELIPCYMAVKKSLSKNKFWFFTKYKFQYYMEYKQQKFSLTKFDIQSICSKLEIEANKSEVTVNIPLHLEDSTNFSS